MIPTELQNNFSKRPADYLILDHIAGRGIKVKNTLSNDVYLSPAYTFSSGGVTDDTQTLYNITYKIQRNKKDD